MKHKIFGQNYDVAREEGKWRVYAAGPEGKKRLLRDILIPGTVHEQDIRRYLEDLFHEQEAFVSGYSKND